MSKRYLMVIALLIGLITIQVLSGVVFGAESLPAVSVSPVVSSPPTVTSDPEVTPSPSVVISPTSSPHKTPTPVPISRITPTPFPQAAAPTPVSRTLENTPTPMPTATPTPQSQVALSTSITPTPPPNIAKSIVNFPKNLLAYIAPKDAYGATVLPVTVSLEFLALGCALVAIGMLALRWEEGDRRVTHELKQAGIALRSWLL